MDRITEIYNELPYYICELIGCNKKGVMKHNNKWYCLNHYFGKLARRI